MVKLIQWVTRLGTLTALSVGVAAHAAVMPILTEGFDGPSLPQNWAVVNNSIPVGSTSWFPGLQGSAFGPQAGANFAAANFNAAGFGGNISDWLLTPIVNLGNGYTLSFYARTDDPSYLDTLEIRLSTSGGSTNVTTDFNQLLLSLGTPTSRAVFGNVWNQYTVTLGGLTGIQSGRFGFRYVVNDTSTNGDFIGLDSVVVTAIPEPDTMLIMVAGLSVLGLALRRRTGR